MRSVSSVLCAVALALASWCLPTQAAEPAAVGGVVSLGAGGYLLTRPEKCRPLPDKVYRTDNLQGPMLTGQWWSSLVFDKYSSVMYAQPLMMACNDKGLTVGYQGTSIVGNGAGIFGSNPADIDFTIGHSTANAFPDALCDGYSDWFVSAAFADGAKTLRTTFGHGSPFIYCLYAGGDPKLTFSKEVPKVWAGTANDAVLGVTINNHHYGLFGATGSTWEGLGTSTLVNKSNGKAYFSVALLPDSKPETLATFKKYAYSHVTDTQATFKIEGGTIKSTYAFTVKPYEGTETDTIYALYPHQWKYTSDKLTDMTYNCVRGTLKVAIGHGFTTQIAIQGVLPMFPKEGIQDQATYDRLRQGGRGEGQGPRSDGVQGHLLGRQGSRHDGHHERHLRSPRPARPPESLHR